MLVVLLVTAFTVACADEVTSTADTAELLWSYEEAYMEAHLNADHKKILAFWDDSFLGWPSRLDSATGKDGGDEYLQKFFSRPQPGEARIERQGIRIIGDVAILQYRIHSGSIASRITHTWLRRDSRWLLLGGMDSPEPEREI